MRALCWCWGTPPSRLRSTHTHTPQSQSLSAPLHPHKPSASCPAPSDGHSETPAHLCPSGTSGLPGDRPCILLVWAHGYSELPPRQGLRSPRPKGLTSEGLSIRVARLKVRPAHTFGPYQLGRGARQEAAIPSFCKSGNSGKSDSRWGLGGALKPAAEGKEQTRLWGPVLPSQASQPPHMGVLGHPLGHSGRDHRPAEPTGRGHPHGLTGPQPG